MLDEFNSFADWAAIGIFPRFSSPTSQSPYGRMEITIKNNVANATKHTSISFEICDAQGKVESTGGWIPNPHLRAAEAPYLYTETSAKPPFIDKFPFSCVWKHVPTHILR